MGISNEEMPEAMDSCSHVFRLEIMRVIRPAKSKTLITKGLLLAPYHKFETHAWGLNH